MDKRNKDTNKIDMNNIKTNDNLGEKK